MQTQTKSSAKDFFINLGAIVALYTLVVSLVNLLFTIIDTAYPKIINEYNYAGSTSISWPVATLIIFFPIFILLMWMMEKEYILEPERKDHGIHKWLTYITLFIAGLTMAGDLITVLYYFLDGQELTTGFLLKVVVLLIIASSIFAYYISDILGKLTPKSRIFWRIFAGAIILVSIAWGFSVLGSPAAQRLAKYDDQRVNDLMRLNDEVTSYYFQKRSLPKNLAEMSAGNYYVPASDPETKKPYEYEKTSETTYNLCANFNKESKEATAPNIYMRPVGYPSWIHPAGPYCFAETITPSVVPKPLIY